MIEPCLSYKILMALSDLGMVLPDFDEAQETIEKILSEYSCEKNPADAQPETGVAVPGKKE